MYKSKGDKEMSRMNCTGIIATHMTDFINSVPGKSYFVILNKEGEFDIEVKTEFNK